MPAAPTAVVVGSGVFGAWSALHLARRGFAVTLVDAWGAGHSRATSGGESRVTRSAYGHDALYARMAREALPQWKALEARSGQRLFVESGVLFMGRESDPRVAGSHDTLTSLGIPHELCTRPTLERRFPQIDFEGVEVGIWEPEGGALYARRAVACVAEESHAAGVRRLLARIEPPSFESGRLDRLRTSAGETLAADRFVFACGPWLATLFPELLGRRLFVTRQEVHFFGVPAGDDRFAPPAMPVWAVDDFYGIPDLEGRGFKLADDRHGAPHDPDSADRAPGAAAIEASRAFLARRFPGLAGAPLLEARVCQYENSSSGDLLIDRHPEADNLVLVGCGSGHGFKHGPRVGELAADLVAADPASPSPLDPRFALAAKATAQRRSVH